jgi:2-polyprenyl-3-methyl-5-hydroxy-6-metoxy-1,4-benzoquinol methylase
MFIRKSDKRGELARFAEYLEWPKCDFCGSDDYRVIYEATFSDASFAGNKSESFKYAAADQSKGNIVKCKKCDLVYQAPRDNNVARIYQGVDEDDFYVASKADRLATCERDLSRMESVTGPSSGRKLIDVGCSYGLFLDAAKARGWNTYGVELSDYQRGEAMKNHPNICGREIRDCGYAEGSFDVMTMFDVVEHLATPSAFLRDAYRIIKPGGYFVACTPNLESIQSKLFGKYWLNFARMHFYYFTPKTLRATLERVGFKIVKVERHKRIIRPINAIAWMKKHPSVYKIMEAIFAKTPLGNLKWASGLSGNMVVYAKKP